MTQELHTRETGRLTRLALDVQNGRNGWGAELTQVDLTKTQTPRVEDTQDLLVSGGTGTRVAQETEAHGMKLQGVEHAFHGEFYVVPQRTLELGAQAWEQATASAVPLHSGETSVAALQNQDRQYVTSQLPKVRTALADIRSTR